ncbi:NLRC3 [Symbiodinium natans]|uniref:NLRC3 protein n=1 Tax=Symbiodinium natans TaxID=878477 RepID=A0A812MEJ7_9DINO|nr:NLRC3 [Symbiodinium natans]
MAAAKLAAEPELEILSLAGEELGRKGAQRLSRALLTHGALRELDLACGCVGDAGMAYIAGALQRNSTLEAVSLRNNSIGADGCAALAEALLSANGSPLTELNLSHNPLADGGIRAIAKVLRGGGAGLLDLDLSSARSVSEDAWVDFGSALADCRLTSLKLRQNPAIGDLAAEAFAQSLASGGSLLQLDVSFCSLRGGCARLLGAAASLRQLRLFGNVAGLETIEALGQAGEQGAHLEDLDLSRCQLGEGACPSLAAALRRGSSADAALRELHLDRNDLGAQGIVTLAEALGAESQLRALTLRENRCGDMGAGAIAKALGRNRSLKELDLAGNEVLSSFFSSTSCSKMSKLMQPAWRRSA